MCPEKFFKGRENTSWFRFLKVHDDISVGLIYNLWLILEDVTL